MAAGMEGLPEWPSPGGGSFTPGACNLRELLFNGAWDFA